MSHRPTPPNDADLIHATPHMSLSRSHEVPSTRTGTGSVTASTPPPPPPPTAARVGTTISLTPPSIPPRPRGVSTPPVATIYPTRAAPLPPSNGVTPIVFGTPSSAAAISSPPISPPISPDPIFHPSLHHASSSPALAAHHHGHTNSSGVIPLHPASSSSSSSLSSSNNINNGSRGYHAHAPPPALMHVSHSLEVPLSATGTVGGSHTLHVPAKHVDNGVFSAPSSPAESPGVSPAPATINTSSYGHTLPTRLPSRPALDRGDHSMAGLFDYQSSGTAAHDSDLPALATARREVAALTTRLAVRTTALNDLDIQITALRKRRDDQRGVAAKTGVPSYADLDAKLNTLLEDQIEAKSQLDKDEMELVTKKVELAALADRLLGNSHHDRPSSAGSTSTTLGARDPFGSPDARKRACRAGLPPSQRRELWQRLVFEDSKPGIAAWRRGRFDAAVEDMFGKRNVTVWPPIPTLGSPIVWSKPQLLLTQDNLNGLKTAMCCIVRTNPELHYAPFLIDLFAHLLLYMTVGEAYDVVQCMLRASRHNHTFFPVTLKGYLAFVSTFNNLLNDKLPSMAKHMTKIGVDPSELFRGWTTRMFNGSFQHKIILRFMDAFLNEGFKIIYRVTLGLFKLHSSSLLKTKTAAQFLETLTKLINATDPSALMKTGFDISLAKKDIGKIVDGHVEQHHALKKGHSLQLLFHIPRFDDADSEIINTEQCYLIWSWLPSTIRILDPVLLYSGAAHGYRLGNLIDRCGSGPVLILVKDGAQNSFGIYLPDPRALPGSHTTSFMNGRVFLFKLSGGTPECYRDPVERAQEAAAATHYDRLEHKLDTESKVRTSSIASPARTSIIADDMTLSLSTTTATTAAAVAADIASPPSSAVHVSDDDEHDDYSDGVLINISPLGVILSDRRGICFSLDAELRFGYSLPTKVFRSPSLTAVSADGRFDIRAVEVWGFVQSSARSAEPTSA